MQRDFDVCTDKLVEVLDSKCKKLKEMVEVMRKLASYTIGKREYLEEINSKAMVSVAETMTWLEQLKESPPEKLLFDELRARVEKIYGFYKQAAVFY